MDKNQNIDCIEMKRRAQERIRQSLRGMTKEQEVAYWAEQSGKLRALREQQDRKKAS